MNLIHRFAIAVVATSVVPMLFSVGAFCRAADAAPAGKPLSAMECEELIEKLASPHEKPFTEPYVFDIPAEYEKVSQRPIAEAYNALSANIEVALPVLMAHIDDGRFSHVQESFASGVFHCVTVGAACHRIIVAHVETYRQVASVNDDEGRRFSVYFIDDAQGGIKNWWKGREKRTLAELQLEGIEWAMLQPKPKQKIVTADLWTAAKEKLAIRAKQIRETKRPISVKHKAYFISK